MRKAGSTNIAFDVFNNLLMAVVVMLTFYPFVYMVMLSLSSENTYAKALFYPEGLSMDA